MRKPGALVRVVLIRLIQLATRAGFAEKSILLAVGLSAAALFGFVNVAEAMMEGDTREFDRFLLLAFRNPADLADPIGPVWFEEVMRDFTALGGMAVLCAISLMVVGYLILTHKRHAAWLVVLSVTSGILISNLLKWGFARPRPDLVAHATEVYTQSFPSGHAMLSAIVYLTLGAILARTQKEPRVKMYLLAVAGTLTLLVGVSRVYLGVHWPTDVIGGWAVGAGWALLCWLIMLWLQAKGKIESAT